jgi:hypothetical protein
MICARRCVVRSPFLAAVLLVIAAGGAAAQVRSPKFKVIAIAEAGGIL